MTTYTITQTQLDLLLGVLERAGTTDDGEYKWDTHAKATKLLQSLAPQSLPSTSAVPLTPHEIGAFVGTHEFGPEQLKWFRLGEAAHGIALPPPAK